MSDPNLDPAERQRALEAAGVIDAGREPAFDDIVRIASLVCKTPVALVNFLGAERQYFKAQVGADDMEPPPPDVSICQAALPHAGVTVINDLSADDRFAANPLIAQAPGLRFYAGARVDSAEGIPLGTVCVIDVVARPQGLSPEQQETLAALARQVMMQLELRRRERALSDSEQRFRAIADSMPQMVWSTLPDGYHDYYNARWYEFTGVPPGSTDGEAWNGMFHPEDQDMAWARWRQSLETGEPYEIEYRLRRHDGVYRWTLGRALPIRGEDGAIRRWFGTCTDIDDSRRLLEERELVSQELSHRIKNIFAVISGLISLSARGRPETKTYADNLRDRVLALGRAHDFVRPHSERSRPTARPSTVFSMLKELFAPYHHEGAERIFLAGDDLRIDDRAATPLALIFHELATNAAKYGALSTPEGHIDVSGRLEGDDYLLTWTELGGPKVSTPTTPDGFGSTLSRVSIEGQLGGRMAREWPSTGLKVTIAAPRASFTRPSRVSRSGE
ncbi:PAS domain-containing protein [Phenylobacterium sp.]|uniref:sensor histidine kinase n=1 Tax=Phenylobacterium sp. TaxID=1871053 RepID=UPI00286CC6C4|nr:PAS domain-containing protein [Phenylobacterium sp.]